MTFILDNFTASNIIRSFLFQYASTIYPQHFSTPDIKLGVLVSSDSRGSTYTSQFHYLSHTTKYSRSKEKCAAGFRSHAYEVLDCHSFKSRQNSRVDWFPIVRELKLTVHAGARDVLSVASTNKVFAFSVRTRSNLLHGDLIIISLW